MGRHFESGFIAQEVKEISGLEHLCITPLNSEDHSDMSETEPYSLNINGIIPYLVASIKELHQTVQSHKAKNDALQTEVEILKERTTTLETEVTDLKTLLQSKGILDT